jgi:hypothetical protein
MNGQAAGERQGWLQKRSGGLLPRWQRRYAQAAGGVLYLRHEQASQSCRAFRVSSATAGRGGEMVVVSQEVIRTKRTLESAPLWGALAGVRWHSWASP